MKYVIIESKLKNLLKKHANLDLTGKIRMITDILQIPYSFNRDWKHHYANKMLNAHGPMYLFNINKNEYIAQHRGNGWKILDSDTTPISEIEFMRMLGIEAFGMSLGELIDMYFNEED